MSSNEMEKGMQYLNSADIPAPPYPGPPLDHNVATQHGAQYPVPTVAQHVAQPVAQYPPQPVAQYPPQPVSQYPPQPVSQYPPQPVAQYPPQPVAQYPPQPGHHTVIQPFNQMVIQNAPQPVNNMVVVQRLPTEVAGQMFCPHCQNNVVTTVGYRIGSYAWIICAIIAVFLIWPCCLIPFCVNSCKDVEHSCPSCRNVIHVHKRS
ncbi:uncharacterized protein ACNS7B_008029 [Menidia menidia]